MMRKQIIAVCGFILTLVLKLSNPALAMPMVTDSPSDLIDAVNALRASYGLKPYSPSSILMYTAQAQAEFIAATGNVTHSGPSGTGVTDRLLAAGYPLAGDLSLGGFRSENIIGGNASMTAHEAVNQWMGDAPHLNSMISPSLTEIGAGVALANGRVYYVIDCALPTPSGGPAVSGGGTPVVSGGVVIPPVVQSTPSENGVVIHEVLAGQTLWQIAIAYEVKVDEIKRMNNLTDNTIYPGDALLISREIESLTITPDALLPPSSPTIPPTPLVNPTAKTVDATVTAVLMTESFDPSTNTRVRSFVIGLIALAILVGGYFAWRGDPNE